MSVCAKFQLFWFRIGGYGKWVKSKSKCATTLGVFRGPFQAIWNQNWVICLKKTPWTLKNKEWAFLLWKCWFLYIACKLILSKRPEILNRAYPFIIKVTYHPQEDHPPPQGRSPTNLRMVTNQTKDGHPNKRRKCTTGMEFGTYTSLTKLTPRDNCHGWSPTILIMVTYHP